LLQTIDLTTDRFRLSHYIIFNKPKTFRDLVRIDQDPMKVNVLKNNLSLNMFPQVGQSFG